MAAKNQSKIYLINIHYPIAMKFYTHMIPILLSGFGASLRLDGAGVESRAFRQNARGDGEGYGGSSTISLRR